MYKNIISRLTMKQSLKEGFIDVVSGKKVKYWIDKYGNEFLAVHRLGMRVKTNNNG